MQVLAVNRNGILEEDHLDNRWEDVRERFLKRSSSSTVTSPSLIALLSPFTQSKMKGKEREGRRKKGEEIKGEKEEIEGARGKRRRLQSITSHSQVMKQKKTLKKWIKKEIFLLRCLVLIPIGQPVGIHFG